MKVTSFSNGAELRAFHRALVDAVKQVGRDYGVDIRTGSLRYTPDDSFTMSTKGSVIKAFTPSAPTIGFSPVAPTPVTITAPALHMIKAHGLTTDARYLTGSGLSGSWRIVDYKSANFKYPWIIQRQDYTKKRYKMPGQIILDSFKQVSGMPTNAVPAASNPGACGLAV